VGEHLRAADSRDETVDVAVVGGLGVDPVQVPSDFSQVSSTATSFNCADDARNRAGDASLVRVARVDKAPICRPCPIDGSRANRTTAGCVR
jgi:hypothetical protein